MKKITIKENEYRRNKRALRRLDSVKKDVDDLHKLAWKIKNKIKKNKIKVLKIWKPTTFVITALKQYVPAELLGEKEEQGFYPADLTTTFTTPTNLVLESICPRIVLPI